MDNIEQPILINKKYPGPVAAGIFFSLTTVFLSYGGNILTFKNSYLKSGLGEVLFVLLPVLVFLIAGKYDLRGTLKLRKTKPINYVILTFMTIFALPVAGVLNAIVLLLIKLIFGKNLPVPQLVIADIPTLLTALLVIGVAAAVCEETLFRGLISKGYERMGAAGSIILTSVLFGILHRDLQKLLSTILVGALLGFIVYRTKSIYTGMVAHFTNNSVAVLLTYSSSKMLDRMNEMGIEQVENFDFSKMPTVSLVIVIVFYGILFLGCLGGFIGLFYAFMKTTDENFKASSHLSQLVNSTEHENPAEFMGNTRKNSRFSVAALISVLPGVILIFLVFVGQILELMNIKSGLIISFLKTIGLN